ncbi:4Fe-4S ferredoxin iron-sulfur binding domain protein [Leptothrix cholodnii SP-6]|uniref:4Fe-4S ferredoxin iron-sulfur binding domain protein n=1 Tax=Leptothrix cholodnii (strain ATCC 51168 / LMG 8142 / SP-6) TaxID=395495 RepID=B1XWF3_LEPCP|nr:NAD(P)-binding domain-containing protein [Leptothrix cholodnii]ACB33821.1 4Fe-4S ferredoxin iron-sulfur binding domain protein [Leptothrix cholodnii SP-6]
MDYVALYLAVLVLPLAWYIWQQRRKASAHAQAFQEAEAAGLNEPPSLHPVIDPARCIGSGSCTKACPEDALGMVGGKAVLVNASACIGHGACQAACPFDAISLVFGTEKRGMEIPPLSPQFESSVPGLYIAGELGGMGLIRKAAEQGRQAMDAIKARCAAAPAASGSPDALDVLIVGCGPAGISAGLAAKAHGLRYRIVEQEDALGGTVYHYPRNKIAMTAPVELAIVGKVRFGEVQKEKLLAFWQDVVAKTQLQIQFSERMDDISPADGGEGFVVKTSTGSHATRTVLLAMGRRGSPRKLDVPGEESAKVVYRLIDAEQYRGQAVLVVGGGDSALEAAISISEQPGTDVTLSYRSAAFSRVKGKNRDRLAQQQAAGRLRVLLNSKVTSIDADQVHLVEGDNRLSLPNQAVIVCAGGLPPTPLLQRIGIRFETKHGTQ